MQTAIDKKALVAGFVNAQYIYIQNQILFFFALY